MEDLKRDYDALNQEIGRLQDALDALVRMQRKYVWLLLFTRPHIYSKLGEQQSVQT